jgi:hypothetical protein
MFNILSIKEIQIKMTVRFHLTQVRMAINKKISQHQWLTPVILATQEAEIRRFIVQSQFRQIIYEMLLKKPTTKKKKRLLEWLKQYSTCLASVRL